MKVSSLCVLPVTSLGNSESTGQVSKTDLPKIKIQNINFSLIMSVDMASIPPWKLAIIERRRKSEEEEKMRQKELERIGNLPSWKRDILVRKQGQRNTMIFLGRDSKSPENKTELKRHSYSEGANNVELLDKRHNNNLKKGQNGTGPVTDIDSSEADSRAIDNINNSKLLVNGDDSVDRVSLPIHVDIPDDTHIIPVHSNPWVLSDRKSRKSSSTSSGRTFSAGSSHKSSEANHSSVSDQSLNNSMSPAAVHQVDTLHVEQNRERFPSEQIDDNAFTEPESEVQYGKGFVNKLLRKFRNLSTKEDGQKMDIYTRRTHSMENLLDIDKPQYEPAPRPASLQMSKANSLGSLQRPMSPDEVDAMVRAMSPEPRDRSFSPPDLHRSLSPASKVRERSLSPNAQHDYVHSPPSGESSHRSGRSPSPSSRTSHYPKHFYFRGASEAKQHEELPRPNYVSSARSIFEEATCVSPTQQLEMEENYEKPQDKDFTKTWDLSQSADHDIIENEIAEPEHDESPSEVMLLSYSSTSDEYGSSVGQTDAGHTRKSLNNTQSASRNNNIVTSNSKPVAPTRPSRKDGPSRTFYAANDAAMPKVTRSNNTDIKNSYDNVSQNKVIREESGISKDTGRPRIGSGETAWSRPHSYNGEGTKITSRDKTNLRHIPDGINIDMMEASKVDGSDSNNDKDSPPITSPTAPPRYKKRKSPPKLLEAEPPPPLPQTEPPKNEVNKPKTTPRPEHEVNKPKITSKPEEPVTKPRESKTPPLSTSFVYGAKVPQNKPKLSQNSDKPGKIMTDSENRVPDEKGKPWTVKTGNGSKIEENMVQKSTVKPSDIVTKTMDYNKPDIVNKAVYSKLSEVNKTYSAKQPDPATPPQISHASGTSKPSSKTNTDYSYVSTDKKSFNIGNAVKEAKQAKENVNKSSVGGVSVQPLGYRDYSGESFLTPDSDMNGGPPTKTARGGASRKRRGRRSPGKLIVKPASNQVAGTKRSSQFNFLNLLKYRDMTKAKFENTIKSRDYLSSEDLEEIYINDYVGGGSSRDGPVPITNIDDLLAESEPAARPEDYQFEGAGVKLKRSLLDKNRKGKKVSFL